LVQAKWRELETLGGVFHHPIDTLQLIFGGLPRLLGDNLGRAGKEIKEGILAEIQDLYLQADSLVLNDDGWPFDVI
jgi:hypothetical protein